MHRHLILSAVLIAGGALSLGARTSTERQHDLLAVEKVEDNLYVLRGGPGTYSGEPVVAGNTTVFVADAGVVVVDTKFAGLGQEILDTIRTLTEKPVTTIINTHTHFDHTGSNTEFSAAVDIVAHENTKANLSQETCGEVTNCQAFKGDNARFLPNRTFARQMSLFEGADRIDLRYFGPGHTSGDTIVVFRALGVATVGDLFVSRSLPPVMPDDGGSAVALVQTLASAVNSIKDVHTVITGHSDTVTWQGLEEYADFNRDVLATVQAAMQAGTTASEAADQLKMLEGAYPGYNIDRANAHVQLIYDELNTER